MNDLDPRLARLLDKEAIREVLSKYARGVDRGDGPLLKSCYHPDAIEEHGGRYTGNAYEYVDGAIPRIRLMDSMQHVLGNTHFDFVTDDLAYVETYLVTLARMNINGERFDTYVIRGAAGSGEVTLNGPAARRVQKGDVIIIIAYAAMPIEEARKFQPTLLFPEEPTNRLRA